MVLEAKGIEKWYFRKKGGANRFWAVKKTDVSFLPGTLTVLTGRSGSGKTTLMHMLGGILRPDTGSVLADGQDLYAMHDRELSVFRNRHTGMMPQGADVLGDLTVMENLQLPGGIVPGTEKEERMRMSEELLERMEISTLAQVRAKELSGGERRRVCLVRALAGQPDLIIADEPTSDLDDTSTQLVLRELRRAADKGAAVIVVTHDLEALSYADRHLVMTAGELQTPV